MRVGTASDEVICSLRLSDQLPLSIWMEEVPRSDMVQRKYPTDVLDGLSHRCFANALQDGSCILQRLLLLKMDAIVAGRLLSYRWEVCHRDLFPRIRRNKAKLGSMLH